MSQRPPALLPALAAGGAAALVVWWFSRRCFNADRKGGSAAALRIAELWVHPIKAVGGSQVAQVTLGPLGLQWDRNWIIYRLKTQKIADQSVFGALKRATATIDPDAQVLKVTCPEIDDGRCLVVPVDFVDPAAPVMSVTENDAATDCQSVGNAAAEFFSRLVGEPVLVLKMLQPRRPSTISKHQGTPVLPSDAVAMQAFGSLHLITVEGLDWLRGKMRDGMHVGNDRFRANVVLSGAAFPDEDTWRTLSIEPRDSAPVSLRIAKHTGRCAIPTLDGCGKPDEHFEPTATLRRERGCVPPHQEKTGYARRRPQYMFGVDAFHDGTAVLRVGDRVRVVDRQAAPVFVTPE